MGACTYYVIIFFPASVIVMKGEGVRKDYDDWEEELCCQYYSPFINTRAECSFTMATYHTHHMSPVISYHTHHHNHDKLSYTTPMKLSYHNRDISYITTKTWVLSISHP